MNLRELYTVPSHLSALGKPLEARREKFRYGIDPVQDDIEREITKFGFEYAGAGRSGIVFSHPQKNYVIKISVIDDTAYSDFINICHTNPHFPKIIGKPFIYKKNFLVTRIETLAPISRQLFKQAVNASDHIIIQTEGDHDMIPLSPKYIIKAEMFLDDFPQWESAIQAILTLSKKHKGSFIDIHEGNIMSRDGFPVFVDPLGLDHII